jgi:hypothetical protein
VTAVKLCQVARQDFALREGAHVVKDRNDERHIEEETGPSILITHYLRKWITRNCLATVFSLQRGEKKKK